MMEIRAPARIPDPVALIREQPLPIVARAERPGLSRGPQALRAARLPADRSGATPDDPPTASAAALP